jgi:hypothetical protein
MSISSFFIGRPDLSSLYRLSSPSASLSFFSRYGSWNDIASFKSYVQSAHSRFGKNIWITEIGITSASNPSQAQVKSFMENVVTWLDTQPYVERVAYVASFLP